MTDMTKLSPADLALITQRAALLEAEFMHRTRELHVEINDDDRNTLKILSTTIALQTTLTRYDGGVDRGKILPKAWDSTSNQEFHVGSRIAD